MPIFTLWKADNRRVSGWTKKAKWGKAMSIRLWEESFQESQVDKEKMVIKNLSILGSKSKNGRDYTDRAMNSLTRLMEGAPSYNRHKKNGDSRDVKTDLIGNFVNARRDGNRVRADLQLLEKEKWLLEVAEKMPKVTGFSIDADGDLSGDHKIVEDITKINSIDLVDKPATNVGLFEEVQEPMAMTDDEKKEMARLQEEVKSFSVEKAKIQEERAKIEEEKKKVEVEKRKISIKEQAEKELPKEYATTSFLRILENLDDASVTEAIKDKKAAIEEAQKHYKVPQKDNTMPLSGKAPGNVKYSKEQILEELEKKGM